MIESVFVVSGSGEAGALKDAVRSLVGKLQQTRAQLTGARDALRVKTVELAAASGKTRQLDNISQWIVDNADGDVPVGRIDDVVIGWIIQLRSDVQRLTNDLREARGEGDGCGCLDDYGCWSCSASVCEDDEDDDEDEDEGDSDSLVGVCVHCGCDIDAGDLDHWRVCSDHPAHRVIEQLKKQLEEAAKQVQAVGAQHCDRCGAEWWCSDSGAMCPFCATTKLAEVRRYTRLACAMCAHNESGWRQNDWECSCENADADQRDQYPFATSTCSGFVSGSACREGLANAVSKLDHAVTLLLGYLRARREMFAPGEAWIKVPLGLIEDTKKLAEYA